MTKDLYNICVGEHTDAIYRYALKLSGSADDAKDAVQVAFEKLWINREKVIYEKSRSWLYTTVYNHLMNQFKREKKWVKPDDMSQFERVSSDEFKKMEYQEILKLCLEKLPPIQKSIIILRDIEGYNYQEIGEILQLSQSQVKVYLFRARKKIKDIVKDIKNLL